MNATTTPTQRPLAITMVCVLGFLGVILVIIGAIGIMFVPADDLLMTPTPAWYPFYMLASAAGSLVSMIGLWQMRRWGLMVYVGVAVVDQIASVMAGQWGVLQLIIPLVVIMLGGIYVKHMR